MSAYFFRLLVKILVHDSMAPLEYEVLLLSSTASLAVDDRAADEVAQHLSISLCLWPCSVLSTSPRCFPTIPLGYYLSVLGYLPVLLVSSV